MLHHDLIYPVDCVYLDIQGDLVHLQVPLGSESKGFAVIPGSPDREGALHKRLTKTEKEILAIKARAACEKASWERRFTQLQRKHEDLCNQLASQAVLVREAGCDEESVGNNGETLEECSRGLSRMMRQHKGSDVSSRGDVSSSLRSWRSSKGPHRVFVPHSPMDLELGHRVRIMLPSGRVSTGTIRYLGHLQGEAELHLGVQLLTPDHGLHDGSHRGHSYFECNPGYGAFVEDFCSQFLRIRHMRIHFHDGIHLTGVEDGLQFLAEIHPFVWLKRIRGSMRWAPGVVLLAFVRAAVGVRNLGFFSQFIRQGQGAVPVLLRTSSPSTELVSVFRSSFFRAALTSAEEYPSFLKKSTLRLSSSLSASSRKETVMINALSAGISKEPGVSAEVFRSHCGDSVAQYVHFGATLKNNKIENLDGVALCHLFSLFHTSGDYFDACSPQDSCLLLTVLSFVPTGSWWGVDSPCAALCEALLSELQGRTLILFVEFGILCWSDAVCRY
ncbi:hypothetical protein F7725_018096 [Dissostichus mawsoni]|uniref:CAP-Gly domain-containing protein n=1 Tax=Dissostichus mawsoni TaxID=36200 RepID=A0A7J5XS65_DISMA|nr:hypothetical protein F7725_018096 [Dissostichus mawsoni]